MFDQHSLKILATCDGHADTPSSKGLTCDPTHIVQNVSSMYMNASHFYTIPNKQFHDIEKVHDLLAQPRIFFAFWLINCSW